MPANQKNNQRLRFIRLWLPVIVWMGVIFYFSSLSAKDIPSLFPSQDIVFHIVIYALLAYFFARALKNTHSGITLSKSILLTVIFGVLYGVSDEFHQIFTPGRIASGFDLFIDGIGSLLGSLSYR